MEEDAPQESNTAKYDELVQKFQRDLNRVLDADRNTRKRGLQKLIEDLPWTSKGVHTKKALREIINRNLLPLLMQSVCDSVEKCRELSLTLLKRSFESSNAVTKEMSLDIVQILCQRINDVPYPETAEELRLQILELLLFIIGHKSSQPLTVSNANVVLTAMSKSLLDSFPGAKRASAEVVCAIASAKPEAVRMSFKSLLKGLCGNASHQHSKTRSLTLKALAMGLACGGNDYESLMKDPVIPLLSRMVGDRSASTRKELSNLCATVLSARIQTVCSTTDFSIEGDVFSERAKPRLVSADLEIIIILLLLHGDDMPEVVASAISNLKSSASFWTISNIDDNGDNEVSIPFNHNSHIVDGEEELKRVSAIDEGIRMDVSENSDVKSSGTVQNLLIAHLQPLMSKFLEGVESWTSESRKRYIKGLQAFLERIEDTASLSSLLPNLFIHLGRPIRDDDSSIRIAAEQCCSALGACCVVPTDALDLLLPEVRGETPGGDTFSQRTSALRVITHVLSGFPQSYTRQATLNGSLTGDASQEMQCHAVRIATSIVSSGLLAYREAALREALLLLVREMINVYPRECLLADVQSRLTLALTYLQGRCANEDEVIPVVARRELGRLTALLDIGASALHNLVSTGEGIKTQPSNGKVSEAIVDCIRRYATSVGLSESGAGAVTNAEAASMYPVQSLLSSHFMYVFNAICGISSSSGTSSGSGSQEIEIEWHPGDCSKAAFEVLVRSCPTVAWEHHIEVMLVIVKQVQPPKKVSPDSPEGIMQSYAAQKGEEVIDTKGDVDVRLSLLALLEGFIRSGSADWQCGTHLAKAADEIITRIILPNLVWRVGRVEATIRKVALACCYAILKAGATRTECLYKVASELVPVVSSHLDDPSTDATPRQMASFCLSVLFERLRGAFGEQAIREIYPMLIKRLDDSNDGVRLAICTALQSFLKCADKNHYRGTCIDYILDQLFIHLDDPEPAIQASVFAVIIDAANIDKALVLKKAESSKMSHRSPEMCSRVITEVQGYEILSP